MIEQVGAGAAYRAYVVVGLLIIVAQLAVIIWLFTQRAVRRRIADGAPAAHSVPALAADNHAILRAIPDVMFVLSREGTYLDYHARDRQMLFARPKRSSAGTSEMSCPRPCPMFWMPGPCGPVR